jgi:serine/threonine protein kinase
MERVGRGSESAALTTDSSNGELEPLGDLLDGRYRMTSRLGGGGMGEVYEVEHVRLKRHFALKLLRRELCGDSELTARFDREARAVATLRSDYVVSIVDSGTLSNARPYFVMERLSGQDLRQLLADGVQLPVARAANIGIDVCLGLHAAHAAGLVHRDLKPENVFVTRSDDGKDRCKLLDFGVVKLAEQDHTRPGVLVGSARYMAPEQVAHDAEVGPRADLFALGVLLYRCLSGQHPFAADSLERVLFRIMNDQPPSLLEIAPHVPAEFSALVEQAMSKAPRSRPASALELARALSRFAGETRSLPGVESWHVDTTLAGDLSSQRSTPSEPTPAVSSELRFTPTPARHSRWFLPLGAAACLISATLIVDRALWGASHSTSQVALVAPPQPSPLVAGAPSAPASDAAATTRPPVVAEPKLVVAAPAAMTKPAIQGTKPLRPNASAPSADASASRPSVNWFDPRNPYGK